MKVCKFQKPWGEYKKGDVVEVADNKLTKQLITDGFLKELSKNEIDKLKKSDDPDENEQKSKK